MITPETVFKSICDMTYEEREDLIKLIVNREPDLADGMMCSMMSKYQRLREMRGDFDNETEDLWRL